MEVNTENKRTTFVFGEKVFSFPEFTEAKIQQVQAIEAELQGYIDGGDRKSVAEKLKQIYKG